MSTFLILVSMVALGYINDYESLICIRTQLAINKLSQGLSAGIPYYLLSCAILMFRLFGSRQSGSQNAERFPAIRERSKSYELR